MSLIKENAILNVKETVNNGSVELQIIFRIYELNESAQVEQRLSEMEVLEDEIKAYCRLIVELGRGCLFIQTKIWV